MAQFGRPSADTNNPGLYTDEVGGSTNIFNSIDEAVINDSDYIQSPSAPSNAVYVTKLSNLEDPVSSSGHIIRFRRAKNAAGGAQINITHELRQGYVNEGAQGTLIKQVAETNVSETLATTATTLSAGEADSITDYTSLYLRILSNQV